MRQLSKVIVVTGGNRGLGWELLRRLGLQFPESTLYLTARSEEAGMKAVEKLQQCNVNSVFHKLDVSCTKQISDFKDTLIEKHGTQCMDILVNNAGINLEADKSVSIGERAKNTVDVNYFGVLNMTHTLLPLMKPGARILNMASSLAIPVRKQLGKHISKKMDSLDLSLEELNTIMRDFVKYAQHKNHISMGYCNHSYGISKYGVISLTRILGRENKIPGVLINCCCPGWVRTDMGGQRAKTSVEDGVKTLLHCITLPKGDKPNGKFIYINKIVDL